jgi:hypothetical protein
MQKLVFDKDPASLIQQTHNKPQASLELATKKILVLSLVNNIEANIQNLAQFLKTLQSGFKDLWFAYLTNNNRDKTLKVLEDLQQAFPDNRVNGITVPDERVEVVSRYGAGNRTPVFARYRNTLFGFAKEWMHTLKEAPDYVLQIDSDLDLSPISFATFATFLQAPQPYGAICANGLYKDSRFFYDTFSLRLLNEPKEITKVYPLFNNHYGRNAKWINTLHEFRAWTQVQSAFGGMSLFLRATFEALESPPPYDESIPGDECEHVSFCQKLKDPVYINPHWNFTTNHSVEGSLYPAPATCIPRDAGFFSVFNFYMAALATDPNRRVYPSWTLSDFARVNKTTSPKHFCYFSKEHNNAWLEYFKPVSFFPSDTTMTQPQSTNFAVTQGYDGPPEFRIPTVTAALFSRPTFGEWRQKTHQVFTKAVQLSDKLSAVVATKREALFKGRARPFIGVHYRHPSHCCEEPRPLLFTDYFKTIDSLLEQHPTASILLCTDTDLGVTAFKNEYGGSRLIYDPDVRRTSLDNILEWAYARGRGTVNAVGMINNRGYELQHTQDGPYHSDLGCDVICDVMLLAQCDHFVHTVSNLALAVSYFNPAVEMHYVGK